MTRKEAEAIVNKICVDIDFISHYGRNMDVHLGDTYELTFASLSKLSKALGTKDIDIVGDFQNDTWGGEADTVLHIYFKKPLGG